MATNDPRSTQPQSSGSDDLSAEELENVAGGMVEGNTSGCTEVNVYKCAAAS